MALGARALGRLLRRAVPDVPMDLVNKLSHGSLVARGADAWMGRLSGHRVQRYALSGKGQAAPVLLLHGLNAAAGSMVTLVPELTRISSRVALLDLPSHGRSPHPEAGALSLLDYGAVALQAAEELFEETGRPVALVGNSLGGALAFYVAQARPDLVAGVVGLNPAGAPSAERSVSELPSGFEDIHEGSEKMAGLLFARVPAAYWFVGRDIARGWASAPVQQLLSDARSGSLSGMVSELLPKVTARALVLWGAEDRMLPYASADELRRLLPNVRVEIVPGAGHVLQVERPLWTARRVAAFIAQL
jgi:pimeloyl-ACP methyl ester carboxylesterase